MQDSDALLIAVDADDRQTGVVEKMAAHRDGVLHRAFSIGPAPVDISPGAAE